MNLEPNDAKNRMSPTVEPLEALDSETDVIDESEIEFDWDAPEMEPEIEESFPEEPVDNEAAVDESEPEFELPAFEIEDETPVEEDSVGGAILQMEPGTEPPPSSSACIWWLDSTPSHCIG